MPAPAHIVVTDSGLGGLSICAALERGLRGRRASVRLTYVNAWPFEDRGYNELPDEDARARVFDGALARMAGMQPDRILIACNTLSILYGRTAFSRQPAVPVHGIVDAGVELFAERLQKDPASAIVLTGTKTTIESGLHRARLVQRGIDAGRIAAVACHGLAGAIERDVDGPSTAGLIAECTERAASAAPPGSPLYLGLCCTHYGYVATRIVDALARHTAVRVHALDPNERMTADLLADGAFAAPPRLVADRSAGAEVMIRAAGEETITRVDAEEAMAAAAGREATVSVELVSKVTLTETARAGISRLIEPVSPATAAALLSYALVPDLF